MRSDNLKKHMKKHERRNDDNIVTKGVHDGKTDDNVVSKGLDGGKTEDNVANNEEQISCPSETFIAVQKRVSAQMKEFNRKIEFGRKLFKIVKYN